MNKFSWIGLENYSKSSFGLLLVIVTIKNMELTLFIATYNIYKYNIIGDK